MIDKIFAPFRSCGGRKLTMSYVPETGHWQMFDAHCRLRRGHDGVHEGYTYPSVRITWDETTQAIPVIAGLDQRPPEFTDCTFVLLRHIGWSPYKTYTQDPRENYGYVPPRYLNVAS